MRRVGHQVALGVEDRAGEVQPFLDVHAHGRVLQHRPGLLGHVHEQVVEQLQQHRIGLLAAGRDAPCLRHHPAQQHMVARRDLRGPARLDHGRGIRLAHQRRPGDRIAGEQRGPLIDRRLMRGAAGEHRNGIDRLCSPRAALGQQRLGHALARCDRLHRDRLHHQRAARRGEAEAGAMRGGEFGHDRLQVPQSNDQRRLGAGVAQMQLPVHDDAAGIGALRLQRLPGSRRQPVGDGGQLRHLVLGQRQFHRLLAQSGLVGQAHAVGRQHPGIGMNEHRLHAQRIGHQARMLAARAAEAVQREAGHVMALLHRDLLDRVRHVGYRDRQVAFRDLPRIACLPGRLRDLGRQCGEFLPHGLAVQRRIAGWSEDRRKMPWLDLADADIGVRHRQRPAVAIAGRSRPGPGAVRAYAVAGAVEMQDRSAAGRHRVDRHHRRTHPHAGHLGLERPLERAGIQRHIGGGAAHVETDDPVEPRHSGGARRADDAAGRPGQDGILALEAGRLGQPAVGLHEVKLHAVQFARHLRHVAAQDRRQIGVHHRRVATRHQPQQRTDRVAGGDLGEPCLPRQLGQPRLVGGEFPGMHQHDGARLDPLRPGGGEHRARVHLVQGLDLVAVHADPPTDLHHLLVQQ